MVRANGLSALSQLALTFAKVIGTPPRPAVCFPVHWGGPTHAHQSNKSWPGPVFFLPAIEPISGSRALYSFEPFKQQRRARRASSIGGKCPLTKKKAVPELQLHGAAARSKRLTSGEVRRPITGSWPLRSFSGLVATLA